MNAWTLMVAAALVAVPSSDLVGRVEFAGLAVPGAVVTATRGDQVARTVSGDDGTFRIADVPDGDWRLQVEMRGFLPVTRNVSLPLAEPGVAIALTMRSYEDVLSSRAAVAPPVVEATPVPVTTPVVDDPLILVGTATNGAATPFAQPRATGNNRPAQRSVYNASLSTAVASSAWNAKPYSFGTSAVSADTGSLQLGFVLSGPLRLPWILRSGPFSTLSLQRGASSSATTQSARVPTLAERENTVSADRIVPQAAALLAYYPLPTLESADGANFQRAIDTTTRHYSGRFQTRFTLPSRNQISLDVGGRRATVSTRNLFDFTSERQRTSVDAGITWSRTVLRRVQLSTGYQFSRHVDTTIPYFAGRSNVSGDAGIIGNDQRPENWGPPTLHFPGLASLADVEYQRSSSITHAVTSTAQWRRGRADMTVGASAKFIAFDQAASSDARGTLTFTGIATGNPFADFLLGVPSTSVLAFNDQAVRLHAVTMDGFVMSDWRVRPGVTVNAGLRWEYESPFSETSDRLASTIRPDRSGVQPRLAVSWRPRLSSSFVLRAGYGLYRNLGTYQSLALLLAQQPPFARSFSAQHSASTPLTLADPFRVEVSSATQTVAIDPGYKAGFVHSWQVVTQRDLPASLTVSVGYFGDHGTHLMQAYVPGDASFVYITSGATSDRHAGTVTIRRRLYRGLAASVEYTLAKATDNASTFSNRGLSPGALVLIEHPDNPDSDRGPSSFDQRHKVTAQLQYVTGFGLRLDVNGTWGSGLPFTPMLFTPVGNTALVGVRPPDTGRGSLRGPSQSNLDLSVSRLFQLPRRLRVEWRIDATNVLNLVTFSSIGTIVGSPQFGRPTLASPMRRITTNVVVRF